MTSTRVIGAESPFFSLAETTNVWDHRRRNVPIHLAVLKPPVVAQHRPPYFAMNADDEMPAVPDSAESSPARRPLIPPPLDASNPQMAHVAQLGRIVQQL